MSPENKDKSIKITLDDLASVSLPDASAQVPAAQTTGGAKVYGSISEASDPQTQIAEEKGSILLQGWFYLGLAGLVGAFLGWAICEPWFLDGPDRRAWQSFVLIASVVTTQSQFKAMRTEEFDRTVMPLMAARAADILDDHGMGALADFLTSLQTTLHWQAYLFDDEGKEILSQPTPPEVDLMAISALQTVGTKIQVSHGTNFSATRTTGSTGTHYSVVWPVC